MQKIFQNRISLESVRSRMPDIPVRLLNLAFAGLFLSLFLVGSCKTSENTHAENQNMGLLPEVQQVEKYTPAKGYAYTARKYITDNPDALLHMTEMQVQYLLGNPRMKWQEMPAEVWQYKSSVCVLDVYFYDNEGVQHEKTAMESGLAHHRKVSYYELRQTDRPDWAHGDDVTQKRYLPSKIQTTQKINHCMDEIIQMRS